MRKEIMPNNECIECGRIIQPQEVYYLDAKNNLYCIECANK